MTFLPIKLNTICVSMGLHIYSSFDSVDYKIQELSVEQDIDCCHTFTVAKPSVKHEAYGFRKRLVC